MGLRPVARLLSLPPVFTSTTVVLPLQTGRPRPPPTQWEFREPPAHVLGVHAGKCEHGRGRNGRCGGVSEQHYHDWSWDGDGVQAAAGEDNGGTRASAIERSDFSVGGDAAEAVWKRPGAAGLGRDGWEE